MKKITYGLVAAGIMMSSAAFAAGVSVPDDGKINNDAQGCILLSEPVKINFSANVLGAYSCDEQTNTITVGTCHTAGARLETVTCAKIGQNPDGTDKYNNSQCQDVDDVITGTPDFRGYFSQTSGGSVSPAWLGGNCTKDQLTANAAFD